TCVGGDNALWTDNGSYLTTAGGEFIDVSYFVATSTTASTFPYASSTALTVSGSTYLGSFTGSLQAVDGLVSASSSLSSAFIEDVYLRNDGNDTTTGILTASSYLSSGSGTSTLANLWANIFQAGSLIETPYFNATSTTATSTIAWGLSANALNITSTSATSTFANGIKLTGGCYLLADGTCAGSGGGTTIGSTVTSGTAGSILFVDGSGNLGQDNTNFYFDDTNNRLGLGTTSPYAKLSVVGDIVMESFNATSTTATSTVAGNLQVSGNLQVGTGTLTLTSSGIQSSSALTLTSGSATYTYPTALGADNQVLTTDSSGTLTWTNAGGGVSSADLEVVENSIVLNAFRMSMLTATTTQQNQDSIVDEFRSEGGIDTATSTNESYDSADFYTNTTSGGVAPTGGTITTSGGNTIHTFTSDGTFTVASGASGSINALLVGGGAGGGSGGEPGGGGGGGIIEITSRTLTAAGYSVVVGGGGAGGIAVDGISGSSTTFDGETATGGGFGDGDGGGGGAGANGGGARESQTGGTGTAPTPVGGDATAQGGFNGGNDQGGGAGAGAVGGNGPGSNDGGDAGAGYQSNIDGNNYYWGGGGGGAGHSALGDGGNGGVGGGGAGGGASSGTGGGSAKNTGGNGSGTTPGNGGANTGGGGGGAGHGSVAGGNGGSGVVIVAFTTGALDSPTVTESTTLISNTTVAETQPDQANIVMLVENSTTTPTLNTDIKAWATRGGDSGDITQNWTQITLTDQGDFDTTAQRQILVGSAD
ncbi:MAG: hypothetical protein HN687_03215, partial [Candidatus Marinimicrobia bacterium]|nr:hypothetical protein [Candidatus Neomarinimicrobiota bacterium]